MELLKNLRYYKTYSLFILIILISFFSISSLVPIYIDSQQNKLINTTIDKLPYHESFVVNEKLFLDSDSPYFLSNSTLITNHLEYSFFISHNTEFDFTFNQSKRYASSYYNNEIVYMSFSNNTIKKSLNILGLQDISQPGKDQIIIDQNYASQNSLSVNDSIYLFRISYDNSLGNNPVKVKIVGIIPHTIRFDSLIISNYQTLINLSNSVMDQDFYSKINYEMYFTYNKSMMDKSSISNTLNSLDDLSLSLKARLGTSFLNNYYTNTIFYDNIYHVPDVLHDSLMNLQYQFNAIQVYLIILQIPAIIVSFFLLNYMLNFWKRLKKEEYVSLYKSGFSIKEIEISIKLEFKEYVYLTIVLSFGIVLMLSNFILPNLVNNLFIILIQMVINFTIILLLFY